MSEPKIGIMQGRLSEEFGDRIQSFPIKTWKTEFEIAEKIGFDCIEWIFDEIQPNPILSTNGISEINFLRKKHNIAINSICADYFMTKKLFRENKEELEKNIVILKKLIIQARKMNISMIEIPLVDSSSLKNDEDKLQVIESLKKIISLAEDNEIIINLETDLNPLDFKELLKKIDHPNINANYDSGNSASLGYNIKEELTILEKWIKNVHVKDRKFEGGNCSIRYG